ncbi:MAG: DUF805 domain-containing protein [Paludibacteraceae bacterium]|nr:DUF805 domain-containing protein [Paludibacteraceae bacterium]
MNTKSEILEHVDEYTAEQLAGLIQQKTITLYDLRSTGQLRPMKLNQIRKILAGEVILTSPEANSDTKVSLNESSLPEPAAVQQDVPSEPVRQTEEQSVQPSGIVEPGAAVPLNDSVTPQPTAADTPMVQADVTPSGPTEPEASGAAAPEENPIRIFSAPTEPLHSASQTQEWRPAQEGAPVAQSGTWNDMPVQTSGTTARPTTQVRQPMLEHPFSFKGRIRRLEMWVTMLMSIVLTVAIAFAGAYIGIAAGEKLVAWIFDIVGLVPVQLFILAQQVKRTHDIGLSGWMILIPLWGFVLLFVPGEPTPNKYGPSPK